MLPQIEGVAVNNNCDKVAVMDNSQKIVVYENKNNQWVLNGKGISINNSHIFIEHSLVLNESGEIFNVCVKDLTQKTSNYSIHTYEFKSNVWKKKSKPIRLDNLNPDYLSCKLSPDGCHMVILIGRKKQSGILKTYFLKNKDWKKWHPDINIDMKNAYDFKLDADTLLQHIFISSTKQSKIKKTACIELFEYANEKWNVNNIVSKDI